MSLKAIIIRAEGALADTDELQREAFRRLIAEAGYDWPCEREDFTKLKQLGSRDQRLRRLIEQNVKQTVPRDDVEPLIAAMQRRLASLMDELIVGGAAKLRPGVKDLIIGAKADGMRLGLVTTGDAGETEKLLHAAAGTLRNSFDCIVCRTGGEDAATLAYRQAVSELGLDADSCLAVEAGRNGLSAAREAGLRVLVTRTAYSRADSLEEAAFVVDSLLSLLPVPSPHGPEHLTPQLRTDLIAALHRLHAGFIDLDGALERSRDMKVSEILKAKGYAVKSISSGEMIWTLAHRLKSDAIGALVVLRPDGSIEGIISERDVARGIAEHGSTLPSKTVRELMTKTVITCSPDDSVTGVSRVMTERRIRHLPVVEDGKVVGLISIGDVLNHRLDQMQKEVNVLRDYVIAKS